MKGRLKKYLQQIGWYEYVRYSYLFYLYQLVFQRDKVKQHKREVLFYKSFLPPCNLIFDIGAYDGHKTAAFLQLSKKVICCEPDAKNFNTLTKRFQKHIGRVFIENKAVSDHEGKSVLFVHHEASAFNTLNEKWKKLLETDTIEKWNEKIQFSPIQQEVELTTINALIKKYGVPDFIKIDVEGYEKWVLAGLSQRIKFISFESMLPDFKEELIECIRQVETISKDNLYNIAVNEALLLPQFVSAQKIHEWAENTGLHHFEIIVKMNTEA